MRSLAKSITTWFYWRDQSLFTHVHLQPRASADEIVGLHGNSLKIRLMAPPVEGKANKYLIKFLATCFNVPELQINIIKGELNRKKWVRIDAPLDLSKLTQFM